VLGVNPRRVVVANANCTNHEWLTPKTRLVDEILPVHQGNETRIIRKTAYRYRRFGGLDKVPSQAYIQFPVIPHRWIRIPTRHLPGQPSISPQALSGDLWNQEMVYTRCEFFKSYSYY
jgi:hypothetical protein